MCFKKSINTPNGDNEDSSDDDTAIPGTVATFIGNATAPAGYLRNR